jgi:endonuclease/exonuclease/phosphatase family metal-dependent hydrolase
MTTTKEIANDNISSLLKGVDPNYIDNDDYIDIVQWNLRWFNSMEKDRVTKIEQVLSLLNSDIFVFQEIAENSLDGIAQSLSEKGKGNYKVAYGTTGGQQRIAIMWDMDWVRTKDDVKELFGKKAVTTPSGKDVFPRLPFWSYFYCKSTISNKRGFDFQLVGVHLKSQMDQAGTGEDKLQRTLSAAKLSDWLVKEANNFDADTIILGDWNKDPNSEEWESLHALEEAKKVKFTAINDSTNFSHLYYINKKEWGSLLDLRVITSPLAKQMNKTTGGSIRWFTIDELIKSDASAAKIKKILNEIKSEVSDHMPVLTRFGLSKRKKK